MRRALWVAGFACLWLNVHDDPALQTGPYLLDVTPTGATIGMVTAEASHAVAVVTDSEQKVVARVESALARRRHALVVGGLRPVTEYSYVVTVDGAATHRGRIRTGGEDDRAPVRFAFLGDSGDQPWWVWLQRTSLFQWPARWGWFADADAVTRVGAAVADYAPSFVVHLGDVVYPKGQNAHYRTGFFRPFAAVLRDAPIYAVLGNHDMMDAAGQQFLANLRPPSWAHSGDGRNFSFARGPVRVIGLDCNTDFTGGRFEPGHPAHTFLHQQLEACEEPWIVVATHFPMRSQSRQGNRPELLLGLLPELVAYGVTLYTSGHDHCYQRFGEPGEAEPVLVVSGGGGKDLYDIRPAQLGRPAVALAKAYHWCSLENRGSRLQLRAHGLDGAILDQFDLVLPHGEALARIRSRSPGRAARIRELGR